MAPPRRSARPSTFVVANDDNLSELEGNGPSSSSEETYQPLRRVRAARRKSESEDEFIATASEEEAHEVASAFSDDEDGRTRVIRTDDTSALEELIRDGSLSADEQFGERPRSNKKGKTDVITTSKEIEEHSRGLVNLVDHTSKAEHVRLSFGIDKRDLLSIIHYRDRWCKGMDSCLPSKRTLDGFKAVSTNENSRTFGVDPHSFDYESIKAWEWYYDDRSGALFRDKQRLEIIPWTTAEEYLPQPSRGKHTVVIGPFNDQKVYDLGLRESLDFGAAWNILNEAKQGSSGKMANKAHSKSNRSAGSRSKPSRRGWILNVGSKIQCVAWAPNQSDLTQYLAIVAPITERQRSDPADKKKMEETTAFAPSLRYRAALQLWSFQAEAEDTGIKGIDMSSEPSLESVICTDWGDLRRISWCPMARKRRYDRGDGSTMNLGLLAGIWSDGAVRVLDINVNNVSKSPDIYRVQSAAFSCKPPSTVCTCVTWLSPSDIAVGCANGSVAIWSIVPPLDADVSDPLPYLYFQVHATYILSIESAYPQHPHIVATTSMDGHTKLTSVADPEKDMVESSRMRGGSLALSYSPILQSFITNDENDFMRLMPVRRFFGSTTVGRLPSAVSSLASCSALHPCLLFGCTGGEVVAVNPMRRVVYSKEKHWQLTCFTHEYAQPTEEGKPAASRFLDGFRAESISLLRSMIGDPRVVNGALTITIYEEGSHITSLAWNPNQQCAGWASAGTGSGLVRVEDLTIS